MRWARRIFQKETSDLQQSCTYCESPRATKEAVSIASILACTLSVEIGVSYSMAGNFIGLRRCKKVGAMDFGGVEVGAFAKSSGTIG